MSLSEKEKQKIEEEERVRAEARIKYSKEYSPLVEKPKKKSRIQCLKCGYKGEGQSGRRRWVSILVLIFVIFVPIIPIIYFLITPKWVCPKCKSKFIEEIDEQGRVIKRRNILLIILLVVIGVAFLGILSSMILLWLG